jgi:two-component system, cell cycle sensor histidine kinase and response regulator CckA
MKILVVDDEPDLLLFLTFLMKRAGYDVIGASTGEESIRKVKEERPDLILLDVVLPDLDGFEICRRIRSDSETKDTFIIILSARRTTVNNQVEGLQAGADGYMTKPVDPDELLARVNAMVRIKRAEDALKQSERFWRTIIDRMPIGCILNDENFCFTYWNPAAERIFGYSKDEVLSKHPYNLIVPPSSQEYVTRIFERLATGDMSANGIGENITKDGRIIICEWHNTPLYRSDGSFAGIISMAQDITERRRAEEKIQEQAALLDITQDAIIVCDLDGNILYKNSIAERVYSRIESCSNISLLLFSKNPPLFSQAQKSVTENGKWAGELSYIKEDQKEIVIESSWTLVCDDNGKPKSILMVNTDITEKKQFQSQFLRAQRLESIGTLASGIAHDLNNILAPILLSVQLLKTKLPGERDQQLLTTLQSTTQRGADLVKQVLSFARGLKGERIILQPGHLIAEVEKIVQETFPRSIEVIVDLPKDLWVISADAVQLHQVLMNLCVNARDAMAQGGTLTISAKNFMIDENYARMNIDTRPGPHVVITVADTGTGIAPDVIDKIFDPFFTTKEVGKGTGLGLSTVIGIVKNHGGFVNVYSEVGKGSEFRVYLPATAMAELEEPEQNRTELPLARGETVLVIDDETPIREATRASLEAFGFNILSAGDGVEAVAIYAKHKGEISVVLLDMMMPLMDGPSTLRALQKINPRVKVVAASGLVSKDKIEEVRSIGIKIFLSKPYTTEELLRALQKSLLEE